MWERHRQDQERSRLLMERRNAHRVIPSDVPYHLSGQRVLEASGFDFAGNVVVPEIPPVVNIPLREQHLRDRVHVPPVPAPPAPRDPGQNLFHLDVSDFDSAGELAMLHGIVARTASSSNDRPVPPGTYNINR